jgi:hypothetical protein
MRTLHFERSRGSNSRRRGLVWLVSALLVVPFIEGFHTMPSHSTPATHSRVFVKQQPLHGDDEDFLQLYKEISTEGMGLAREFHRQQQQQVQSRKEQERLEATYCVSPSNSAGFFNTGNAAVQSVPSMQRKKKIDSNAAVVNNEDNWLLIFANSMVAQSSQQVLVLQKKDQQQQVLLSLTALLLIASLFFALSIPNGPVDTTSATTPMILAPTTTTSSITTLLSSTGLTGSAFLPLSW